MLGSWATDLRHAVRNLGRSPGLALVIILSVGLGIGANTLVFTWMDALVLRPLPGVAEADRLVRVNTLGTGGAVWSISWPAYRDWRVENTGLEGLAVYDMTQFGLRTDAGIERVWGNYVSGNLFDVLRVRMHMGRGFHPDEEDQGAPVAVISHAFWRRHFHSDPDVLGRHLVLNGLSVSVIGVTEPRFNGPEVGLGFDLYAPATLRARFGDPAIFERRGSQWLSGIARLTPGVTTEQADASLDAVARRIAEANGREDEGAMVQALDAGGAVATFKAVFLALLGVTALVLLIACANVANLLLARASTRQREIGIRLAIGAGRGRIIRQLLAESAVLAVLGGGVALLLVAWGRGLLAALIPAGPFPLDLEVRIDGPILAFATAVTGATVLLFGLVPALRASRPDLVPVLKDEMGGPLGRSRLRNAMVVGQVALASVTLVAAGLFLRGLSRANDVDLGFTDPGDVLLVSTDLSLAGMSDSAALITMTQALERARQVPGVVSAAWSTFTPLGFGGSSSSTIRIAGYEADPGENMSIQYAIVSGDYMETMGMTLREGRALGREDRLGTEPVAVVNETFARRFFKGQALGQAFNQGGLELRIVGVVEDVKVESLTESPRPFTYRVLGQSPTNQATLHVRGTADKAMSMAEPLRRELARVAPDLPFLDPRTLAEQIEPATLGQRIGSRMLGVFGFLALLLAGIGIYAVMAQSVTQRTREIGVRVALGADRRALLRMVVGQAIRLTAVGLVMGGILGAGAGVLLRSLIFGVSPLDPVTFGVMIVTFGVVAVVASALPARRAASVDPVEALRAQ